MILILQAVLVMLATVVSTLLGSNDLPPVPEDSKHVVTLEGSEPLPNPEARQHYATTQLPHQRAVSTNPGDWHGHGRHAATERNCATTVTMTVTPSLVPQAPELPELPEDYCSGPGQFLFKQTNECYLYLSDGLRTFEDADAECRKGGMRLAKPKKPLAIQKHLVEKLGHTGHIWLGARGDGQSFVWETNDGASIRNTDPNWWSGMPAYYITNDRCLVLVAYQNAVKQEKVFYPEMCSLKRSALCQRSECSPQCTMGTCTGPNTCVYDPRSHAICPEGCVIGKCTGPGECTCSYGYTGDICDKPGDKYEELPTGDTTKAGATSYYSSEVAARAFSAENQKEYWRSNHGLIPATPQSVWYQFGVPTVVTKFSFQSRTDGHMVNWGPSSYEVWGSDACDCKDQTAWVILFKDHKVTPFTTANTPKTGIILKPAPYRCYGIKVLTIPQPAYGASIHNLKFFGFKNVTLNQS